MQIVADKRTDLETSGIKSVRTFQISASAKAFKILSSGLYSNKIKAIIRELSTNAIDSHKEAGNPNPIEVHMPTMLAPYFSVKDNGTGLTRDQVENIYTTYFESTKTDSNDYIGALGLGSKSPFSYTDNFTITAIKDGEKVVYSAYICEQGKPSVALMFQGKTDEPNGMEVQLAVQEQDIRRFEEEAKAVYTFFKQTPKFNTDLEVPEIEYERMNLVPGVHVISSDSNLGQSAIALMGNIAYPIDIPSSIQLTETQRIMLTTCHLALEFDIGDLDLQPSREGLSYITLTVDSIVNKIDGLAEAYSADIEQELSEYTNGWDRYAAAQDISGRSKMAKNLVVSLLDNTAKNYPAHDLGSKGSNAGWSYLNPHQVELNCPAIEKLNIRLAKMEKAYGGRQMRLRRPDSYDKTYNMTCSKESLFLINDTKSSAANLVRYNYTHTINAFAGAQHIFTLTAIDKTLPMQLDEFFKLAMSPPAERRKDASTLEKVVRVKRASLEVGQAVFKLTLRNNWRRSSSWTWTSASTVLDDTKRASKSTKLNKRVVYVKLVGSRPRSVFGNEMDSFQSSMNRIAMIPEMKDVTVYGVRAAALKEVESRANWVELETHLAEVATSKLTDKYLNRQSLLIARSEVPSEIASSTTIIDALGKQSKLRTLLSVTPSKYEAGRVHETGASYSDQLYTWSTVLAYMTGMKDLYEKVSNARRTPDYRFSELFTAYPMAVLVMERTRDLSKYDVNTIAEYIKLVDKA